MVPNKKSPTSSPTTKGFLQNISTWVLQFKEITVALAAIVGALAVIIGILPDYGTLTVETYPENARVHLLDSKKPYENKVKLRSGKYNLEVSLDGWHTLNEEIQVEADKLTHMKVELKPILGFLIVNTTPKEAIINLLNFEKMYQPRMELLPGKYEVEVSLKDWRSIKKQVLIKPGKASIVKVNLTPNFGTLHINAAPRGAKVQLINISKQYKNGIKLAPGTYTIEVSLPGWQTVTKYYNISEGITRKDSVELTKIDKLVSFAGWLGEGNFSYTGRSCKGCPNLETYKGKGAFFPQVKIRYSNYVKEIEFLRDGTIIDTVKSFNDGTATKLFRGIDHDIVKVDGSRNNFYGGRTSYCWSGNHQGCVSNAANKKAMMAFVTYRLNQHKYKLRVTQSGNKQYTIDLPDITYH